MSEPTAVHIDPGRCKSYGICTSILPDVFGLPAGSPVATLLRSVVEPEDVDELEEAVRACPAQAITSGQAAASDPAP